MAQSHDSFVTVYKPIAGWKSVLMVWDSELSCYAPWQTGYLAWSTKEEAMIDGRAWAEAEGIEFKDGGSK